MRVQRSSPVLRLGDVGRCAAHVLLGAAQAVRVGAGAFAQASVLAGPPPDQLGDGLVGTLRDRHQRRRMRDLVRGRDPELTVALAVTASPQAIAEATERSGGTCMGEASSSEDVPPPDDRRSRG